MHLLTIIALAFGLAMDAFAVAIGVGLTLPKLSFRVIFRLSFHFGFFQFLMPIVGYLAGLTVQKWLAPYDHWLALILLSLIGSKMIYESFRNDPTPTKTDPTRGLSLIVLSVATSIDALAVGLSMAFLSAEIWLAAVIIGIVAAAMTIIGMFLGRRLGKLFSRKMELIGGLILIAIGIKIVIEHLTT